MITIKDFMQTINYKITEGSEYCWECFGSDAYRLEYNNSEHNIGIIFDTTTQVVYQANVFDYVNNCAYQLTGPNHINAYINEAKRRGVRVEQAWDDVDFIELEVDEDFIEKACAILAGVDYDKRVQVPLTLPDDEMFELMKLAHKKDITLNQLVVNVLRAALDDKDQLKETITSNDYFKSTTA